jgi:peptidoglycan-associated lipoprotein
MKRSVLLFAIAAVVAGCASTDEGKPVPVDTAKPAVDTAKAPPRPPETAKTQPVKPEAVQGWQMQVKDPQNILSRRSIFFDYDQFVVKEEFKPVVSAHARLLSQNRDARMTIQGNTDERGSREYNLALGQKRADAVRQAMTLLGAPSAQIETISFGEEKPRTQGASEQAYAENRRADIVYQGE